MHDVHSPTSRPPQPIRRRPRLITNFNRFHAVLVARHSAADAEAAALRKAFLARALEANRSGGGPGYRASIRPADGNNRVVERGLDVRHACGTTRFSRFFLNSFLRFEVFAAPVLWRPAVAVLLPSQYPRFNLDFGLDDFGALSAPAGGLLPGRDFLLRRDGALPRTLARPRIGVRALAMHR